MSSQSICSTMRATVAASGASKGWVVILILERTISAGESLTQGISGRTPRQVLMARQMKEGSQLTPDSMINCGNGTLTLFGRVIHDAPGERFGSLTLEEVLLDHIKPLKVPAWSGAMIGHIDRQFTIPEGTNVEIDATKGTIAMLDPAVR